MSFFTSVLLLSSLIPCVISINSTSSDDAALVKFLTSREYDPSTRPGTATTIVNISINSFTLFQMDQTEEMMEFSAEFMLSWFDPLMKWNLSEFDITWTKLKESYIWMPDTIVSSSIKSKLLVDPDNRYADIRYDGLVSISYYGVFTNLCPMTVSKFPFDTQTCSVEIGPWSYTSAEVYSQPIPYIADWNYSVKGISEWQVVGISADQETDTDVDIDFVYTTVVWLVRVKRTPEFYVWVLLVPSFIITTIAIFGIFVPTNHKGEREEKVTVGLTTLLSTAVILQIVASTMPVASSLPLLGNFILAEIFVTAAGVLVSLCVLLLHNRAALHNWRIPRCLSALCRVRSKSQGTIKKRSSPLAYSETEENRSILDDVKEFLDMITSTIEEEESSRRRNLSWNRIFDSIDIVLLVLFQVANVAILCVMT